jgi:flagellar hook assembly protein FlgD
MQKRFFLLIVLILFLSAMYCDTFFLRLTNGELVEFNLAEIEQITFSGQTSVSDMTEIVSKMSIKNFNNYPNPFNPSTSISFELSQSGKTIVEIFNGKGQKVKTLLNENLEKGAYTFDWNGKNDNNEAVATGVYFCRISSNNEAKLNKMVLLK